MIDRKRLMADAVATAPWVAHCKGISTNALAFIVFHGGGSDRVIRAKDCTKALGELGSAAVLRRMADNYGRA